jgi:AhpC/TSA family
VCVPLPQARRRRFLRGEGTSDERFNLAELARLLDMPALHDAPTATWCFVDGPAARAQSMASLEAPDFTLPDLAGQPHSLNDYRGQKIFMVAWASW